MLLQSEILMNRVTISRTRTKKFFVAKKKGTAMRHLAIMTFIVLSTAGSVLHAQPSAFTAERRPKPTQSVPEPTTLLLVGVAAGIAGIRKLRQRKTDR
jgi:hypothetical protein